MHGLDDQGLYWFEEPIVYDNIDGCAQITREIRTPIQIGENIYGQREFYKAVRAGAADLYMPDMMLIGGVTGWLRSAAIAGAAGAARASGEISGSVNRPVRVLGSRPSSTIRFV